MCKAGGPRCPKEAKRLLKNARDRYSDSPTKENRNDYHQKLYQYQLTRTGLNELKTELERRKLMKDEQTVKALKNRIERLEWDRAALTKKKQAQKVCNDYMESLLANHESAKYLYEELLDEGTPMGKPNKADVLRWFKNHPDVESEPIPLTGQQLYAVKNLQRRIKHKELIDSLATVKMEPAGSQADQYPRDENGRISEVYYASYGSNMSKDRFMVYLEGGKPEGSSRTYKGCTDSTPPKDDIPVKFENPVFYAMNSRVWSGGIAFMDYTVPGDSLGRAYLISSRQFDEVVAQESGDSSKEAPEVDLETTVQKGTLEDDTRTYGTLVHVGDYEGRPVMTFTSKYNIQDSMYGDMRFPSKTGKKYGPRFLSNSPSGGYLRMIGKGLQETFGIEKEDQVTYFTGTFGASLLSRSTVMNHLETKPEVQKPASSPNTGYKPLSGGSYYQKSLF